MRLLFAGQSVSGEGHSTILLAHYIFWLFIEDKATQHCWLLRKIAQKCLEIVLLLYNFHILASDPPPPMLFFEQLLRNFLLKKQVLIDFRATFAQLFEKLRETLKKKKNARKLWEEMEKGIPRSTLKQLAFKQYFGQPDQSSSASLGMV